MEAGRQRGWADWREPEVPFSIGVEEEVMLLDPADWALDQGFGELRERLSPAIDGGLTAETQAATIEYETEPRASVGEAVAELEMLRALLADELREQGAAVAGS